MSAPFQITECRSVSAAAWLLLKGSRELLMFAVSYHEVRHFLDNSTSEPFYYLSNFNYLNLFNLDIDTFEGWETTNWATICIICQ